MRMRKKQELPVGDARRFLEPGPVVLVSSAWRGRSNIMTMGWHMIMETQPSLIGCYIWSENHSFDMVRKSRECVINIPEVELAPKVVGIGNTSGRDTDKFAEFGLTPVPAEMVAAPLVGECHTSFECRLIDASLIRKYSLFVLQVVRALAASNPRFPRTIHYRGEGEFMLSGENTGRYRRLFEPGRM